MCVVYKGVGGWEESGEMVGVGEQAKGRPSLLLGPDSGAVFSAGDKDVHKPQDRLRWQLAAVWLPASSD